MRAKIYARIYFSAKQKAARQKAFAALLCEKLSKKRELLRLFLNIST